VSVDTTALLLALRVVDVGGFNASTSDKLTLSVEERTGKV